MLTDQAMARPREESPLLALDTAGPTAGVAVYHGRVLAEVVWRAGRRESAQLLSIVDTALRLARVEKSEIGSVAVASGPGSYSGLRVGLATATGLALALGIGIAQVPTLDVLAWAVPAASAKPLRPAVDVGRGRYASARFRRSAEDVEQETPIISMDVVALQELAVREDAILVADLDPPTREQVERAYSARLALTSATASVRRPGLLAELAVLRIRRGAIVPGLALDPVYAT